MENKRIHYALRDGKLVHISEVKRGKACGCICIECKEPLIANLGHKYKKHFKHMKDTKCKYGPESVLHILGKEVIQEMNQIRLPQVDFMLGKLKDSEIVDIDKVYVEHTIKNVKFDLIIEVRGQKIGVEIYNTHKVDLIKTAKIINLEIPTIEVDLSKCEESITKDELKELLLSETNKIYWIYNKEGYDKDRSLINEELNVSELYKDVRVFCPIGCRCNRKGIGIAYINQDCEKCPFGLQNELKNFRWFNLHKILEDEYSISENKDVLMCLKKLESNFWKCYKDRWKYKKICGGNIPISNLEDYNTDKSTLATKYESKLNLGKKHIMNGFCPECDGKLVIRENHNNVKANEKYFVCCEHYMKPYNPSFSDCIFTMSWDEYIAITGGKLPNANNLKLQEFEQPVSLNYIR